MPDPVANTEVSLGPGYPFKDDHAEISDKFKWWQGQVLVNRQKALLFGKADISSQQEKTAYSTNSTEISWWHFIKVNWATFFCCFLWWDNSQGYF